MPEQVQGVPWVLISPLPVRPLPHDLCHGWDSPRWLPAVEDHLWALIAIWAFLPIGSDVSLLLKTICEHEVLLRILAKLILTSDHCWGPLGSTSVIWLFSQLVLIFDYHCGPFVLGFWHLTTATDHLYPLQCSCLENPRDGGAWWAAVYGVTQSQTQLKRLSSSSGPFVLGKCLFGTPYWSPLERVYDRSVVWYVTLCSICITGILVTLCKMGNSGSVH